MIAIDTSALIDSLSGPRRSAPRLRSLIEQGERIVIPSLVLYEWWRGPRLPEEIEAQESLFPSETALLFGSNEAALAAGIFEGVKRPRGREIDIAIAAIAIVNDAYLWTLNRSDFEDLPGLTLV